MEWMKTILRKREQREQADSKADTVVFVNFEHWNFSLQKLYHLKPDIDTWMASLNEDRHIRRIYFFADFSVYCLAQVREQIQEIADETVDTQDAALFHRKSMTDTIMMNRMYQFEIEHPEIKNYIIFTGNGQFQYVVEYLRYERGKTVTLYGIKDAINTWLKGAATKTIELPAQKETVLALYPLIAEDLQYISDKKNIIPTFRGTVKAVAGRNGVQEYLVHAALVEMIEKGLIVQEEQRIGNKRVVSISADWEELERVGILKTKESEDILEEKDFAL